MKNFWKNKRVLVTGGSGFIGSNAVRELLERDSIVTITVSRLSSNKEIKKTFGDLLDKIKIRKVDLLSLSDCLKATKNIDVVLNFAALDGGAKFKEEHSEEIYKVNTGIVKNILEASRRNNVDRVLLMSSIDVYPRGMKQLINEEDADMNSKKGYVGSKIFSEKLAKEYYDKYSFKIAIARVGNVYGPGDTVGSKRARVIPTFIKKAIKGENIEISISQKLSFLHVSDLVNSLLDLTEKFSVCTPINLVGAEQIYLLNLAKIIIKLTSSKSKILMRNKSIVNNDRRINTEKARKIIGFKEKINLNEGLNLLIGVFK